METLEDYVEEYEKEWLRIAKDYAAQPLRDIIASNLASCRFIAEGIRKQHPPENDGNI